MLMSWLLHNTNIYNMMITPCSVTIFSNKTYCDHLTDLIVIKILEHNDLLWRKRKYFSPLVFVKREILSINQAYASITSTTSFSPQYKVDLEIASSCQTDRHTASDGAKMEDWNIYCVQV